MALVEFLSIMSFFIFVIYFVTNLKPTSTVEKFDDLKNSLLVLEQENQKLNKQIRKLSKKNIPQFDKENLVKSLRKVYSGEEEIYEDNGKTYTANEIIENINSGTLLGEEFYDNIRETKPMSGEELRILKNTASRLMSKTPTSLRSKGEESIERNFW